jgi:protein CpxP
MNKPRSTKRWILGGIAAVLLGLTAVAGTSFAMEGGMHGGHGNLHSDPAAMDKHIDAMVNRMLADGTAEQRSKVSAIAKAACADLRPMRTQLHEGHAKAAKLLSAPTIDKVALESIRLDQMRIVDDGSKRILQAVIDSASVLTPEQRVKLSEHLSKRFNH